MSKILLPAILLFTLVNEVVAQVTGEANPCQNVTYTYTLNGDTCLPVQWSATNGTVYSTGNKYVVNVVFSSTGSQSVTALTLGQAPGCNTYLETMYVTVKLKPSVPTLTKSSGDAEICTGESWTLTASLSGYPSNYGYDWYATGGVLIDGYSSSVGSPIHTTSNQVTLTPGSGYGTCSIYVRMNNYSDCASDYTSISTQVGTYSNSQFSVYGSSSSACPNQSMSFTSSLTGSPVTGYAWTAPSGWSPTTSSSQTFYTNTPSSFYGGVITLQLQNRCGWTGTPATAYVSSSCYGGGGGGYYRTTTSPNPASNSISITPTEESGLVQLPLGTIAQLYDSQGALVKTASEAGGSLTLDVSTIQNGLYFVKVFDGLQVTTKQVQVQH